MTRESGRPTSGRPRLLPNLLLALVSTLLAVGLMGATELALRLAGVGELAPGSASRLKYQQLHPPILEEDRRPDGTAVWRPTDIRLPYQEMLRDEPAGLLRIVTVGGSAAAGLGFSPNATFSRYLERMLRRADPERPIEVLDLGIVALASAQVRLIVEDVCTQRPDVVIVYSGNNEFLELHATKFADLELGPWQRVKRWLGDTHLRHLADRVTKGPPRAPSLAEQDFSNDDLRLSEAQLIRDIEVTPEEEAQVLDRYESNLEAMAAAAQRCGATPVLMAVASNWKWRGARDLPADWLAELLGGGAQESPQALRRALAVLSERLAHAPRDERAELLFRRAVAHERLAEFAAARDDYRAAMNADPHRRRALDAGNDRVRAVAARRGVPFVDTVAVLSGGAEHGIPAFAEFYDYVHFTPGGALRVAGALFAALEAEGFVPNRSGLDPSAFRSRQLAQLSAAQRDAWALPDWLGFSFDKSRIADRDLWKYERMLEDLDRRIEADPSDADALVYRGNARSFEMLGAEGAERDYRAALALAPARPEPRANLERLLSQARPRLAPGSGAGATSSGARRGRAPAPGSAPPSRPAGR